MKIAVFGLSLSSSWGNGHATTYRALLKALAARGHDITFYERDQPWYADNRDLAAPAFCRLVIYRSLDEIHGEMARIAESDAVILGSFVPEGLAVAEALLAAGVRPLAFYDIDTPVTLAAVEAGRCEYLTADLVPAFDLYLSFSGGEALRVLRETYRARSVVALPCSVDAAFYNPVDVPKRWDMGYLGTYSADRQPGLERLLLEPARRLPAMRFVVAGAQYPEDIQWPDNVERIDHVPPEQHPRFYSSLRFALNVTRTDMVKLGHSPSVRLFEAAGCATPVVSDNWPGLGSFFALGREVIAADTPEEVMNLLSVVDPERAAGIGLAARTRILREHESSRRAAQLEEALSAAAERLSGIPQRMTA